MNYSILACDIIGYASVIEEPALPRVLAPVLRLRDSSGTILLPPFRIVNDAILGAKATNDAVFDAFCRRRDTTRLPEVIPGEVGYDLWVNPEGVIGYGLRQTVKAAFRKIFEDHIKLAEQSLKRKKYPAASRAAAVARAVAPSNLEPLIVRAVVERIQGKGAEEEFTRYLASDLTHPTTFDELVSNRLEEIFPEDPETALRGIAKRPTACV